MGFGGNGGGTSNIQHSTSNINRQRRIQNQGYSSREGQHLRASIGGDALVVEPESAVGAGVDGVGVAAGVAKRCAAGFTFGGEENVAGDDGGLRAFGAEGANLFVDALIAVGAAQ